MPITVDVRHMMEKVGGEESIEFRLRRFEDDVRYLHSLRHELLRNYLNKWVAVCEGVLVAHGKSATELLRQLSAKGIPANEAVIDFIASERKAMLL